MKKEVSGSATEETSHTSLASVCSTVEAPWRVERIRMEAPGEADWWKEEEGTTDDTWLTNSSSEGDDSKKTDKSFSSAEGGSTGSAKKFHNCGLETWEASRAAWTARPDPSNSSVIPSRVNQSPPSKKELAKIIAKASSLRACELPRRTPLKNMIESYVMVWNGDE